MTDVKKASSYIKQRVPIPETGLILGSGLGELAKNLEDKESLPYSDIPGFTPASIEGHEGRLVVGELNGTPTVTMQGRAHFYEHGRFDEIAFPIRVLARCGVEQLLITNAAGGVNLNFTPGDLMLITDHINNMPGSPLIGADIDGPQFPDMSQPYDPELLDIARGAAERKGIAVQEGVYMANTGPQYETPAEVRAARSFGADAVGASTVPEVIVANALGVSVLGISCITNMAAGIEDGRLTHDEVIETADRAKPKFKALVRGIVSQL